MLLDLIEIIEKYSLEIKGVIHIGAHYGQEHILYKKLNIENIVYFEPLSNNFKILKENVGDNVKIFNLALGNETKEVEMFVESANNGMSSSVLKPVLHLKQYPHIVFTRTEKVNMVKLNDVSLNFNDFNFINIDVQGYELEVFKGASNVLNNIDYVIAEVNRDEVYENCTKIDELDNFLLGYNFERKEVNWAGNTWGDAFYLKIKK